MINEKKCPVCSEWTDGNKPYCTHCGALIDPQQIAARDKKERADEKIRYETPSRFKEFLDRLSKSENPFAKFSFFILRGLFNIYMAILSFFLWLIALASG